MLIVVRHGRTEINAEGRLQGRTDLGLDEVGQAQAAKVGALLHGVDRVVASPLRRAQETAAAIGQPVETDDRWVEYDYGELEGLRVAEVPPEVWTGWRTDPDYAPPGGESHAAVYRRVTEACEELIRDARDRQVVVVTHVSPIKVAVAWALGLEATANQRTWLDVASITRIELRGDRAVLRSFNETLHLA